VNGGTGDRFPSRPATAAVPVHPEVAGRVETPGAYAWQQVSSRRPASELPA